MSDVLCNQYSALQKFMMVSRHAVYAGKQRRGHIRTSRSSLKHGGRREQPCMRGWLCWKTAWQPAKLQPQQQQSPGQEVYYSDPAHLPSLSW